MPRPVLGMCWACQSHWFIPLAKLLQSPEPLTCIPQGAGGCKCQSDWTVKKHKGHTGQSSAVGLQDGEEGTQELDRDCRGHLVEPLRVQTKGLMVREEK